MHFGKIYNMGYFFKNFLSKFEHLLLKIYKQFGTKFFPPCLRFKLWHLGMFHLKPCQSSEAPYFGGSRGPVHGQFQKHNFLRNRASKHPKLASEDLYGSEWNIPKCQRQKGRCREKFWVLNVVIFLVLIVEKIEEKQFM